MTNSVDLYACFISSIQILIQMHPHWIRSLPSARPLSRRASDTIRRTHYCTTWASLYKNNYYNVCVHVIQYIVYFFRAVSREMPKVFSCCGQLQSVCLLMWSVAPPSLLDWRHLQGTCSLSGSVRKRDQCVSSL